MCRDVALNVINGILEDIHNDVSVEKLREKCEDFKRKCDYEELQIVEGEIRKDRLKEYIRFFNISSICEYDIFEHKETFYKVLEDNLNSQIWEQIRMFLSTGNILSEFQFSD